MVSWSGDMNLPMMPGGGSSRYFLFRRFVVGGGLIIGLC